MKLHFAGGEAWADLLLDMGVKYQLFSYYYFRQGLMTNGFKARNLLARLKKAKAKGYGFMLDSGAFTYQVKANQGGAVPEPSYYFQEYKDFLSEYGDLFDIVVEFDIDGWMQGFTTQQVDEWTNGLMAMPNLKGKVMPVFHTHRGERWLQDYLQDVSSPLIGLGSAASLERSSMGSGSTAGASSRFIATCHRWGKFVHGLAQTRIRTDMKYTEFDSVDSTTWLRSDKYGGSCYFINDKFIVLDHKHKADRARYKSYYERWGLDFAKIMKDDLDENRLATIIAWRELANSFERKHHFRGGKYPYLYEAYRRDKVPSKHPYLTQLEAEGVVGPRAQGET